MGPGRGGLNMGPQFAAGAQPRRVVREHASVVLESSQNRRVALKLCERSRIREQLAPGGAAGIPNPLRAPALARRPFRAFNN